MAAMKAATTPMPPPSVVAASAGRAEGEATSAGASITAPLLTRALMLGWVGPLALLEGWELHEM